MNSEIQSEAIEATTKKINELLLNLTASEAVEVLNKAKENLLITLNKSKANLTHELESITTTIETLDK